MFCGKCGRSLPMGQSTCSFCDPAPQDEEVTRMAYEEPAETVFTPDQDSFELNTPEDKPEKKKVGKIALIAAGAAVLVLALIVVLCWNGIAGMFKRNFAKPEAYMEYVEKQNVKTLAADLAEVYDESMNSEAVSDKAKYDSEITLEMSDELVALLQTAMASSDVAIDISWVESITLKPTIEHYGNMWRVDLGIGLNDTNVISAIAIIDLEQEECYISIPELNKEYLRFDLSEFMDEMDVSVEEIETVMEQQDILMEAMPDAKQLEKLINKYAGIVLANLPEVEKEKDTLEAEGLEEKVIVLSMDVSQKDIIKIATKVVEELQEDEEVEKIIMGIVDAMNEVDPSLGADADDVYEEFQDALDEALDELDYMKDEAENDTLFTYKSYVNKKHEVIGRALRIEGEELEYYTVTEGKKFGFYAGFEEMFEITGKGTRNGDKRTGTFTLVMEDVEYLTVELEDFGMNKKDVLTGTVRIEPSSELLEEMDMNSVAAAMLGQVALELTFAENRISVAVDTAGNEMVKLIIGATVDKADAISAPKDSLDVNDQASVEEWFAGMDASGFVDKLEDAGVPSEYTEAIESLVEKLAS